MGKVAKRISGFICLSVMVGFFMYQDYHEAYTFSANGIVVEAKWNTKNHGMSLFLIKEKFTNKKLHHWKVLLEPEQIKVGDSFYKEAASKFCTINGRTIQCVK